MTQPAGRPRASSRETLAEAACELFYERGYQATSAADIAARAGVSRSSFFNYFPSKADVFWWSFDEQLDWLTARLRNNDAGLLTVLQELAGRIQPDTLALALTDSAAMGATNEVRRDLALRRGRLTQLLADHLTATGTPTLPAQVAGAAAAAAVLAAVHEWSRRGPTRTSLGDVLTEALQPVARLINSESPR